MKKLMKTLQIAIMSFVWFLISPFPFEYDGWRLLGGLRLIKAAIPFGDSFDHETDIGRGFYTSTWYPILLLLFAVSMGTVSFVLIHIATGHKRSSEEL